MFDIDGTLVSLDLVERFFCCDLDTCLGSCCIEGDSGAPLTEEEYQQLKAILPEVWDDREGRIKWRKPISCYLYPVRVKRYPGYEAVNFDRWKICKCAEVLGRHEGIRLYQFLREPLIERFGQQWYDQLVASCELYIKEYLND